MKKNKYPRLRSLTRKGRSGQVWVYYTYDMRGTGKPDVRLGKDYAAALEQWHRLHNHLPATIGRVQEAIDRWRERELPKYANTETRRGYEKALKHLEPVFGNAAWHEITLPTMREYLDRRTAKRQGNNEMAVLSIVWSKARLWGMTQLPWPAAGVKSWKNPEQAREFRVTDALFDAVYAKADRVLRDAMDLATATGMRITDVRTVRLPQDGVLRFKASKTGKLAEFVVSESPVLSALVARREAMKAHCVMLLTTDTGRQVTARMLRDRYDDARDAAALANPVLADQIRAMWLRDMRKRAADLATDLGEAQKLLQHGDAKTTSTHYRAEVTRLRATR